MRLNKPNIRKKFLPFLPIIVMFPAIFLGSFTMFKHLVPTTIWAQNILTYLVISVYGYFAISYNFKPIFKPKIGIAISLFLLIATFMNQDIEGVYRWVTLGPITLYVGSIVLPYLTIHLGLYISNKTWWKVYGSTLSIVGLIFLQPDASLTTAFSLAMLFSLYKTSTQLIQKIVMLPFIIIPILSWYFLDNLKPVAYVEDILQLTKSYGGYTWFITGIFAIILLITPFITIKIKVNHSILKALCIYFICVFLSTQFGHFPVPLFGYGISPILGYGIALIWLAKSKHANGSENSRN